MVSHYKDHRIESTAYVHPDTRLWSWQVRILYGDVIIRRLAGPPKKHLTAEAAEREGLEVAMKWLDDGKPDL